MRQHYATARADSGRSGAVQLIAGSQGRAMRSVAENPTSRTMKAYSCWLAALRPEGLRRAPQRLAHEVEEPID
jgi:hypothetical protein